MNIEPVIPDKKNQVIKELYSLSPVRIPVGSYIYFCSEGGKPIDPSLKEMPPMKYLWSQLKLPKGIGGEDNDEIPTIKDSWFCSHGNEEDSFYVYRVKRPLTLLFYGISYDHTFGDNIIEVNNSLKNEIRNPLGRYELPACDYIDAEIAHSLFNIDGLYSNYKELILFSPFDDKIEFITATTGEGNRLSPGKPIWEGSKNKAIKDKIYFKPTKNILNRSKVALLKSKYADIIRPYLKENNNAVGAAASAGGGRRKTRKVVKKVSRKTRRS